MQKMQKVWFFIGCGILVIIGLALIERTMRQNQPLGNQTTESGQTLPSKAELRNFSTQKLVSLDTFKGRVLLINFWASWCEACIAEMPSIAKLYSIYRSKGLEVISINVDENPQNVVPDIVRRLSLNFPIYLDVNGSFIQRFDVVAIPFSIVTDRQHFILWTEGGERDWASDEVLAKFKALLEPK